MVIIASELPSIFGNLSRVFSVIKEVGISTFKTLNSHLEPISPFFVSFVRLKYLIKVTKIRDSSKT